jgi:hypothetical protein
MKTCMCFCARNPQLGNPHAGNSRAIYKGRILAEAPESLRSARTDELVLSQSNINFRESWQI